MAASKPVISQFQDVIRCGVCDDEVGKLHCDTCQVYICKSCTGTHVTSDLSKQHVVVECNKRSKIKLTECKAHTSHRCELHCKQCDVSVCSKCMASTHEQHKVIDILEFCKSVQEKIREENQKIEETMISLFEKSKLEIKSQIESLPRKYDEITKEITQYGEMWHKKIDDTVKHLNDEVEKVKETILNRMRDHQQQQEDLISHCRLILQDNTKVLQSDEISSFNEYKSKIQDIKDIPLQIDVKLPKFQAAKFENKAIHTWFGSLKTGRLEIKSNIDKPSEPVKKDLRLPLQHICQWLPSTLEESFLCENCYGANVLESVCKVCGKRKLVCFSCYKTVQYSKDIAIGHPETEI